MDGAAPTPRRPNRSDNDTSASALRCDKSLWVHKCLCACVNVSVYVRVLRYKQERNEQRTGITPKTNFTNTVHTKYYAK